MKRRMYCFICLIVAVLFAVSAFAETKLPTINSALRSGKSDGKTEVSDNLDAYHPLNDPFTEIEYDFQAIVLQREAPQKEFTAKKVYPPFDNEDGFDSDFKGVDIGESKLWLRSDMMNQLPSDFQASSLEGASYLLVAENEYVWDGTLSVANYKESDNDELPEFKSTEEMLQYFAEHPRVVESITYYPKFGVYSMLVLYETKTKRSLLVDYIYTPSKRFARNPEASLQWFNMEYISNLLDALDEEKGIDIAKAKDIIEILDFAPEDKKNIWSSCINSGEYSTAVHSITEYFWSMAEELKALDPSSKNKKNYDLIIDARDRNTLSLFVNYCDYSGFDRELSSIERSGEYIASPDYEWMDKNLKEMIDLLNQ